MRVFSDQICMCVCDCIIVIEVYTLDIYLRALYKYLYLTAAVVGAKKLRKK